MAWHRAVCYTLPMTELLKEVMRKVEELPEERQNDAAQVLLQILENEASPYQLTDEQLAEVELAVAEVDSGKYASEAEVKSVLGSVWG